MESWWNDITKGIGKCWEKKNTPIATFIPQIVLGLNLKTKIKLNCVFKIEFVPRSKHFPCRLQKDRECTCDVTMRRVRATIVAMEKQL